MVWGSDGEKKRKRKICAGLSRGCRPGRGCGLSFHVSHPGSRFGVPSGTGHAFFSGAHHAGRGCCHPSGALCRRNHTHRPGGSASGRPARVLPPAPLLRILRRQGNRTQSNADHLKSPQFTPFCGKGRIHSLFQFRIV